MEAFRYNPYTQQQIGGQEYQNLTKSGELPSALGPNNVLLQINYACFLKCQMCDRHTWNSFGAASAEVLNISELDELIDQLQQLHTRKLTIVGTEPILRKELPEILTDIRKKGIKPELYTAGIKLEDSIIHTILDTETDVAFSVDGFVPDSHNIIRIPDASFDAFGKTLQSIKRLSVARSERGLNANHVRISANFTVQKGNISDLTTVSAQDIDHIGVDTLRMSLVHGNGTYTLDRSALDILRSFVTKLETIQKVTEVDISDVMKYAVSGSILPVDFDNNILVPSTYLTGASPHCHIGEYSTMIDPQGNVRPCIYLYDDNGPFTDTSRDKYIMGNIKEDSFSNIWNGEKYTSFRKGNFPDMQPGSRCRTCEYLEVFKTMDNASTNPPDKIAIGW